MALAAAARQGSPRAHPKEVPARRDGEPRQRRGAQADGRRQGRQAEAGRAGRRAEQPQKYSGTFGACEGAKIFGDIWAAGSPPKKRAWEKDRAFFGTVVLPDGGQGVGAGQRRPNALIALAPSLIQRATGYGG